MEISAVTFDLWDTLVIGKNYKEFRLSALKTILNNYYERINDEALNEAYLNGFMYSSQVIASEGYRHVETGEIVDVVLNTLGCYSSFIHDETIRVYEDAILQDPPQLKEGVLQVLDFVKSRYKVGLVSVTGVSPGRVVRKVLDELGIINYFDALTFSDEVKFVKPHPTLFNNCLQHLKVDPWEAVHVGDSFKGDVVGAIKAGMRVFWLKTREQATVMEYEPDAVILDIRDLPELLVSTSE